MHRYEKKCQLKSRREEVEIEFVDPPRKGSPIGIEVTLRDETAVPLVSVSPDSATAPRRVNARVIARWGPKQPLHHDDSETHKSCAWNKIGMVRKVTAGIGVC